VAVSLTVSPVKDSSGRVIGASRIARDITEAKRAQNALKESEERFRIMANAAPVMIWMSDLEGLCTFFNQAWLDFTGRSMSEELGRGWAATLHPEDMASCLHLRAESLERQQAFKADYRLRRADGEYRWITDHGVPRFTPDGKFMGYVGGAIDITERKHAEERFVRLNETLVSVLESIPDIVFVTGITGRIQFRNPAGSRFIDTLATKDRLPAPIQAELDRVTQTGQHHLPTTFKTVHPFHIGQQERFFLSRIVAMKTPDQRVFGAVVMLQDVTEFRLLDEVKTNLISTVSHELKTPMTSLRTAVLLLSERTLGPLTEKQAEMLGIARDEAERLLRTLNELLDLTRFEEDALGMRIDSVPPAELIQAAVEDTQAAAATARMAIKLELEPDLPTMNVHRERILHVLTNFLSNAIRYSPEGQEIVIRARKEEEGIYFSVADSGPGVPRPYQSRIFEKFVRVPGTPKKGVGLGLSIAREFVRAHGGRIGVHSEPGQGSEFYFILPLAVVPATPRPAGVG
jgi:PAS domain S-box-containing protein